MTSSTNQHRSTPNGHEEGPSSPDRTEYGQHPPSPYGTPVNNLSDELLSYIFTLGSEAGHDDIATEKEKQGDEEEEQEDDDDDEQEEEEYVVDEQGPHLPFQVLVSHVCQQWRAVAIETPTLWTSLDFEEGPPFDKSRTWLERSKECPLVIVLDFTVDSESESGSESDRSEDHADSSSVNELVPPEDRVASPGGPPLAPLGCEENKKLSGHISPADLPVVRDLILPHYSRWRVFELVVNDFQLMYDMLSTLASIPEAPELRVLKLSHIVWTDFGYWEGDPRFSPVHLKEPFFAPFCGRAPELRVVYLWGVHVDWETCVFLQGLEELELGHHEKDVGPPYEVFTRILQGSPNLHTLTLSVSAPAGNPEEDWPADVIELPSVKQLGLVFADPSYASALLRRLVFPNLSALSLKFDPKDCTALIEQLASPPLNQLHSVCQNLVELRLSGTHCSDTTLATLYAALPNLISLNIDCYHLPFQFFEYLFPMPNLEDLDGYYLPKLITLTTYGISIRRMRRLVSMRRTIKHVKVDSSIHEDNKNEAWLRAHTESLEFFDATDDEDGSVGTTAESIRHPFIPPSDGTPVNNLPNELLSYIFTIGLEAARSSYDDKAAAKEIEGDDRYFGCYDDDSEKEQEEQGPHLPFQVLVSHVCQQWRAVAIETLTLWAFLDFEEGPPFDKSRTWLERSKECPLDIALDFTVDSDSESESGPGPGSELDGSEDLADSSSENELVPPQDRVASPGGLPLAPLGVKEKKKKPGSHISPDDLPVVRDFILHHSARCRVFELRVHDFQIMYDMLSTLASIPEAPELRALRLYNPRSSSTEPHFSPAHLKEPFFAPFCGRAPGLRAVTLWGVHVDWETCIFLRDLEEFELGYHTEDVLVPYEVFTHTLRRSPDLHTLTFSASAPAGNPEVDWPADVIELPSVRQLDLTSLEPAHATELVKRLVCPNLSVLSLDLYSSDYTACVELLACPPPSRRLWVYQDLVELKLDLRCSGKALRKLYTALPNVISLDINYYDLKRSFEYLFLMSSLGEYYLPKLTTLKTTGVSVGEMRRLVSMRPAIKHVQMDGQSRDNEEDDAWLRVHTDSFRYFFFWYMGTAVDLPAESDAEGEGDGVPGNESMTTTI